MAVDPYAPCPCGSGKKVKFCCSDLVGDIEKIHRMIEGDQPRAALRHAEQTLAKHPGRASVLDLKATLEQLVDFDLIEDGPGVRTNSGWGSSGDRSNRPLSARARPDPR